MRITLGKTKSDIVFYLIIGAALLFGMAYSVLHYPETALVYFLLGLILIPRFELNFKTSLVPDLVFPLSAAFLAIYFYQDEVQPKYNRLLHYLSYPVMLLVVWLVSLFF